MLAVHMPKAYCIGDTVETTINGEAKRVTWRDEKTLLLEPNDPRVIFLRVAYEDFVSFLCGDSGGGPEEYVVIPGDGGFYVWPANKIN
jgi:hypothetical protein